MRNKEKDQKNLVVLRIANIMPEVSQQICDKPTALESGLQGKFQKKT
jgi:hypothetical protein